MDEIIKKLNEHDKRFDEQDKKFDRITKVVVENKERLDCMEGNMATKEDTNNIMNTLDELVGLHKKTEQEQVMVGEQVKRNTKDIEKIKPLVGLESS